MEFKECAACAAKPGSPTFCESCLHNRTAINQLLSLVKISQEEMEMLAKYRLKQQQQFSFAQVYQAFRRVFYRSGAWEFGRDDMSDGQCAQNVEAAFGLVERWLFENDGRRE